MGKRKKKSEETQGHLENIPVPTQRVSQKVSPKGVPSSRGVFFPWAMFLIWKKFQLNKKMPVLVTN